MKKSISAVLASAAIVAAVLAPAARADDDALQTGLKAAYDNQCTLIKNADYDGFAKTMTPDYVATDPNGKQENLAQTMTEMKAALSQIEISACHVSFVSSPTQQNGMATAVVVLSQDGTYGGSAPLGVVARETDTWSLSNGTWLLKTSNVAEQTVTVSGRVVQHLGTPASPAP